MSRAILIRGARQLLTLSGESGPRSGPAARDLRIINDGALLILDGKIAEAGPSRRLERLNAAKYADHIDADGRVVMPGFIDCCVSLLCGSPRHAGEPAASESREIRGWSAQRMELEARLRLRNFVRSGTTTLGAGCGSAFDESSELKALRVLASIADRFITVKPALHAYRIPPEFESAPEDYQRWLASDLIPAVRAKRLAAVAEIGAWPAVAQAAHEAGLACRIRGPGPIVEANGVAVLLPGRQGPADCPGPLALSTGFHSTHSPFHNMQSLLWFARSQWGLSIEEAISGATINAAHALGAADRAGSLEPEKDADLLILQTGDYRDLGWYLGTSAIAAVMRAGVQIFPRVGAAA